MASNRSVDKASGLNLQAFQKYAPNGGLRHEIVTIPSDTTASFGGYFTITFRETNVFVHQLLLAFTANAISGMTTTPRYTPANFWIQRIELFCSGNVIDTIYPNELHLLNNIFFDDADRLSSNKAAGHYASINHRYNLATSTNTYYVNLRNFFDQCHIPLLTSNHNIQLRVYMDSLANCTAAGSGTATNTGVTSCSLVARISRIDTNLASSLVQEMSVKPFSNIFHQGRYFITTVSPTSTSTPYRFILSPIVGQVAFAFITARSTTSLAGDNYFNYQALTSFAFLDGAGQNIVGGSHLPAGLVRDTLMKEWSLSGYSAENDSNLNGSSAAPYIIPISSQHAYMYSFSPDPITAYKTGSALGSRRFNGTEILEMYFPVSSGTYQIEAFFFTENILTQTLSGMMVNAL